MAISSKSFKINKHLLMNTAIFVAILSVKTGYLRALKIFVRNIGSFLVSGQDTQSVVLSVGFQKERF